MNNPIPMHAGRRDMARELGVKFEGLRVAAHDECRRNEGAIGALKHAEESCQGQMVHWKKQAAEGVCTAEEAQAARDRIDDCCGALRNLLLAAEQNLLAQRGKLAQAEAVLDACQEAFDYEGTAIESVAKALEQAVAEEKTAAEPEDGAEKKRARTAGERPEPSVAAKRKQKAG